MNLSTEHLAAQNLLQVARNRTASNYSPFVVDSHIPIIFRSGLSGSEEISTSVAAYGLIADSFAQSAYNDLRRSISLDSVSSLGELQKTLRESQALTLDHLVSSSTKDAVLEALSLASKRWSCDATESWFRTASGVGLNRVERSLRAFIESDRPFPQRW